MKAQAELERNIDFVEAHLLSLSHFSKRELNPLQVYESKLLSGRAKEKFLLQF